MKAICFERIERVRCLEIPNPEIESPTDAIVQVELAGLCGSDLHPFFGRETGLDAGTVMGHEFVGRVVEVGTEVHGIRIGDRVFAPFSTSCGACFYCMRGLPSRCNLGQLFGWRANQKGLHGGQAEQVRVPLAEGTLKIVPPGLSASSALLLGDNFSTGYYCAEMAGTGPDGVYAVIGCGTVGLLAIVSAKLRGAKTIIAIDPVEARRQLATELGVLASPPGEQAVSLARDLTDGRGVDAVMELVGLPDAQRLAYQMIRPGGIMSVIGCHCTENFAFSPVAAYDKNLTYRTGRCPARHYMDQLTEQVVQSHVELDRFITHRFAIDDCERAYQVFSQRQDGCLKAAFEF